MSQGLPGQPIIGRRAELERLDQLLARGARLVTVLGPPGMGKTRLALEYARRREVDRSSTEHETTAFCALGNVVGLSAFCAELAHQFEVKPARVATKRARVQSPIETLAHALAARPLLLVLDNFEQL